MTDMPDPLDVDDVHAERLTIRADLVATKDAEIARLRKELSDGSFYKESDIDALVDRAKTAEEIIRLRGLLQWRQSAGHAGHCAKTFHKGECDCGLDAVVAYFREIEG